MCHQAVGLIQAELERRGIRTASITMLPEVTAAVRPPRALSVPFPLGYPLGRPSDVAFQLRVLRELLRIVPAEGVPLVVDLAAAGGRSSSRMDARGGEPSNCFGL
jgi:hypothetical protein